MERERKGERGSEREVFYFYFYTNLPLYLLWQNKCTIIFLANKAYEN